MSSRGGVPSFVVGAIAGAVCSAAVICLYQNTTTFTKCRAASESGSNRSNNKNEETAHTRPVETRMDSCELDQRMIRKAEGAILNRTSRLIVVVERCTNDHNYSAILRTVEALGVQHVYIIAPQCIQSTLTTMTINEDDKENDDVKIVELKRSSGQPVRRATESDIKGRALHHLYATRATEWLTVTGK
jgi:tRNA G18 (ribose-2'-O)-methylase SpoU